MDLVLVHLVRGPNGPEPLQRFLASYRSCAAGGGHRLLLALKGFPTEVEIRRCVDDVAAQGVDAEHVVLPDDGLDLTAYARVVRSRRADRYCFVNSYSRILSDDWLAHLNAALDAPGVALAGATGSWTSQQDYRRYHLGLPSGYRSVFVDRESTRQGFLELTRQRNPGKRDLGRAAFKLAAAVDLARDARTFAPFPNPHLRTNAFIARSSTLKELGMPQVRSKRDAYRLESGTNSITRQILRRGERVVVVDRAGAIHDPDQWDATATFWAERQQNLLVADNQTDDYEKADPAVRALLSRLAWGTRTGGRYLTRASSRRPPAR